MSGTSMFVGNKGTWLKDLNIKYPDLFSSDYSIL
jgi:hypothetical protein